MRKTIVLLTILLLAFNSAAALDARLNAVNQRASPDKPAVFNLVVNNTFNEQKTFKISSLVSPAPDRWFSYQYLKELSPGEQGVFRIEVRPDRYAIQQNYNIVINLRANGVDNLDRFESYVSVDTKYDINIFSTELNRTSLKPGESTSASITLLNTAGRTINNYGIRSYLGEDQVYSQKGASLDSGSKATFSYSFQAPEGSEPGDKVLQTRIYRNGEIKQVINQTVNILAVRDVRYYTDSRNGVVEKNGTVGARNVGNAPVNISLNKTVAAYIDPFTTFSRKPDGSVQTETGTVYSWNSTLKPGEETSVTYRVRYWPPVLLLGLVFLGLMAIKYLHRDISFSKTVERDEDGITVHIKLENSSNHSLEDIRVKDFVPDIAKVEDDFPMAKPVIRKTSDGTRLNWKIERMEPGEQRVFEYHITPMFEVEGGVVLPEAEIESEDIRKAKTGKNEVEFRP
ncbi:MAG: hypothetical protein ABEJ99_01635 [Candidatus Nanohaloarchaea archaeon]